MRKKSSASGFSRLAADHWRMNGVRVLAAGSGSGEDFGSGGAASALAGEESGGAGVSMSSRITLSYRLNCPASFRAVRSGKMEPRFPPLANAASGIAGAACAGVSTCASTNRSNATSAPKYM